MIRRDRRNCHIDELDTLGDDLAGQDADIGCGLVAVEGAGGEGNSQHQTADRQHCKGAPVHRVGKSVMAVVIPHVPPP